jgi:hypothetical protein
MVLVKQLAKKKKTIVKDWFDLVAKSYAPDTAQFIKNNKDPFANPVGGNFLTGLEGLFDQLLAGLDRETVRPYLDQIIRIRAVQDFTPSEATAFIPALKTIIRNHLKKDLSDSRTANALLKFESNIDSLNLFAFDIYMECREKIFELKANVERTKIYTAFERAGLIDETPEESSDLRH